MQLFISHSHKDKEFADKLSIQLVKEQVQVWVDRWELNVGDSITEKIQTALTDASHLLVILSKHSVSSDWCKREITTGLVKELDAKRVVVLPVLVEDCEVPLFLRDKLYADFRTDFTVGLNQVLVSIAKFDKESLGRITEDGIYFTDYANSWGKRGEYFELRIDVVDFSTLPSKPYSILTNIVFIGNEEATKKYDQYVKQGKDWIMNDIILLMCAENKEINKKTILIKDDKTFETTMTLFDPQTNCMFRGFITIKRLGEPTGKDIVYYLGNIFEKMSKYKQAK